MFTILIVDDNISDREGIMDLMAWDKPGIKITDYRADWIKGGPIYFHVCDICHNFGFPYQLFAGEVREQGYTVKD